jgi:hypothetical protein
MRLMRLTTASLAATAAAALAGLAALAAPAEAYPRFQLSTGAAQCQDCHISPGGGGLIDDYGRLEAGDTISRGGEGALFHGAWEPPSWLALGGDVRAAGGVRHRDEERQGLAFPMQAELYAAGRGKGVTVYLAAGLRGGARDPQPPLVERLASREHYLMYQRGAHYVRAGRFFPVFGLRSQDHTAHVRRYLGFGILEEPYGVAGGRVGGDWEAHVHAYVPRPIAFLGAGPRARGIAASYERRLLDATAAVGVQARVAATDDDRVITAGVVGKRWFEGSKLLLHAELDVQRQSFTAAPAPRWQLATFAGATQTLTRGVLLGAGLHRWQPDLGLRSSRDAFELDVQYFPRAHVEVHVLGRAAAAGNDLDNPGLLLLAQLHYYL